MRRRELIGLLGAISASTAARAQQPLPVIGFLNSSSPNDLVTATTVAAFEIARLAAANGVAAVYPNRFYVESGGLLSYSVDNRELTVRAAAYVDRILKGASAAELPIQRPTKYELVINLKTARLMGVDITPTLLARADEVIE